MSIKIKMIIASFLLFLPLLYGCSPVTGRIFTHIRVPYTKNLNNTPVTNIHANGIVFHAAEPVSGYNFYIELDSNAIGDIAKKHGLKKFYFADLEIFSILGIWKHEKLHIYGEKNQFSEKENSGKKGGENEK
ncbi:MAG: hypothetical protein JRD05_04385 [Deltaproteobacteria bacterium]|nr:hypothetical protein [Deltaproteobacteria bacterium]